jgi:4-amino-4-deoxy-L-arabinose transferase-like glycosyltransferase
MNKKLQYLPYIFLIALLPAMILRDFSPANELRYLNIADEAIRQGHVFAFTSQGAIYADKPPLYLWIIMTGKMILGRHCMWFLSLFSFVPAIVTLRVMDRWVQGILGPQARLTGCIMLMSCGLFLCLSVFLRMDMLMCMFITLALYTFWKTYTSTDKAQNTGVAFAIYIFLALFTKGPIGFLVPLISTIMFLIAKKETAMIKRFWGWKTWSVLIAGCATWFILVWIEGGGDYLNNLLFHQTIDRAVNAYHHKEPVYFYLLSYWYLLAPWSLLIAGVYISAFRQKIKLNDIEKFFMTVIITTLVMLSLISSKLGVYLLPTFPFFVYLTVSLMQRIDENILTKIAMILPASIFALIPAALAVAAHNRLTGGANMTCCVIAAIALLSSGVCTLWLIHRGGTLGKQVNYLACGIFVAFFALGLALPSVNCEIGYGEMCQNAKETAAKEHVTNYYTYGIKRPENMVVYLDRNITKVNPQEILSGKCNDGILMVRRKTLKHDKRLKDFIYSHKCTAVGDNLIMKNEINDENLKSKTKCNN